MEYCDASTDRSSEPMEATRLKEDLRNHRRPAAGPTAVPHLSIVIVTWNSERWIDRCLRALPAACEGLEYEVLVYDNGSRDATLRLIGNEDVRLVASSTND